MDIHPIYLCNKTGRSFQMLPIRGTKWGGEKKNNNNKTNNKKQRERRETQDHNNEYNISFRRAKDTFSRRDASRAVCSWTDEREKTVETAGYQADTGLASMQIFSTPERAWIGRVGEEKTSILFSSSPWTSLSNKRFAYVRVSAPTTYLLCAHS